MSLDGTWDVWLDEHGTGLDSGWVEALTAGRRPPGGPAAPLALAVPGPLEAHESTRDYDGAAFYVRRFRAPDDVGTARSVLRFDRVDHACRVWLDGRPLGEHEGDLDAFAFDCTGRLRPGAEHVLVVLVIDPGETPVYGLRLKATPHAKQSWYENFGGLLGPVTLDIEHGWSLSDARVEVEVDGASGRVRVTATLAPPRSPHGPASLRVVVSGPDAMGRPPRQQVWRRALPSTAEDALHIEAVLEVPAAPRWSPDAPRLHGVTLEVAGRVLLERRIGFRSLALSGGDLVLDGRPLRMAGVLWQPHFIGTGGVLPDDEALAAVAREMKATGFDLVRAHVRPAPDAFLDECDRIGLLVLEEPGIGWVDEDPALPARMLRELDRMVARHGHHPSIVAWGVLNELSGRAYRHADALTQHLAALDPTRPVLEDSGAFFGAGRIVPPGGGAARAMVDRHAYPPYPLPVEEREVLRTLAEPGGGPVFVSEFGHGTLLDSAAAVVPFRERGTVTAERIMYESWAALARRARAAGEAGPEGDWVAAAADLQADAAEDMIEVLRSNPAVDMYCYTQWQAVSQESSAGVLAPWGSDRPVRERIRRALRPLAVTVVPTRPSVLPGEAIACRIAVVNGTGAAVDGTLVLACGEVRQQVAAGPWPTGVSAREALLPPATAPGDRVLQASLLAADGVVLDRATPRTVVVAHPPKPLRLASGGVGPAPTVWAPPDEPATQAFLRRWGIEPAAAPDARPLLALIGRPDGLVDRLPPGQWLALWQGVREGGAAIVLAPDPARDAVGLRFGTARGERTLASLPEPVTVAAAPGHFMARVHVTLEDGVARLLGRGDEVLSPVAMLVADLPERGVEHVVTLGFLGNRVGAPDASLPLGGGTLHLIGMPLLDPLEGRVEPRRDARLAQRLVEAAAVLGEPGPGDAGGSRVAPPVEAEQVFLAAWRRIDRLVALSDRVSPFAPTTGLLDEVLRGRSEALIDLLEGRRGVALERITAAAAAVWGPSSEGFLQAEARVLDLLGTRVAAAGREDWDRAYDALSEWVGAVTAFQAGRVEEARLALDRATLLLGDA